METTAPAVASRELTEQERRILRHVAADGTNDAIAKRLYVSTDVVKTGLRNACQKLGARNRAHAVALATQWGFITLDHVVPRHEP
ncbi:LuxR C-terminal-related transcriptional regulator [Kitasatospora phosalacinea]|uniref:LuxR C-terminal-related transcriptional regulator n=1 Tax=Kitasatospora phosalacinea TaxID=2065 RepID=A0ABW6GS41_9ACTN